jgi:methyl-accepting chemotaxis protein/methyl-accepting chemotaxis protein-1 (serine sensor receptor)
MTVGKKLALIGAFLIVLTITLGVSTLVGLAGFNKIVKALSEDSLAGVSECSKVESAMLELRGDAWKHIASSDPKTVAEMDREIQRLKEEISVGLVEIEKAIFEDEERQINVKIKPALERYYRAWDAVVVISREGKNQEAAEKYNVEANPAFTEAKAAIRAETEFNRKTGTVNTAAAASTGARMQWLTWLVLIISVVAGSGIFYFVVRGINLVLHRTVSELAEGAEQITSASSQVASSSQSLAQGASEQAASLEETSASSEEITSMTRKNAENSQSAAAMMGEVDRSITEGNRTVEQMVTSMREITSSSDKISKIIKVIDEIAFQTNILALNAAVEAARAGEAGMGFAVVADEVRNLAQRSAQAAKDTAALIEESISKSNEGSTKLQQVTKVIQAITESATKVKTLVDEVNLGSQEQARGIEQISKAIAQMDQVTQSTAANAEESASASEEMSAQAEALGHIVVQLRSLVGGDGTGTESRQPVRKAASKPIAKSLAALKSAVGQRVHKPVQNPVPAGSHSDFPMEDNFTEM